MRRVALSGLKYGRQRSEKEEVVGEGEEGEGKGGGWGAKESGKRRLELLSIE